MASVKKALHAVLSVLSDAFTGWMAHKAPRMGGALAYYTVFSIGPLLLIAIAVAGAVFGSDAASNHIFDTMKGLLGDAGATVVQNAVKTANKPGASFVASTIGVVSLMFGASGVFGELHDALNTIWGVKAKELKGIANVWAVVKDKFVSFSMVFGTGFLLLVSLVVSTGLTALGKWLSGSLPGGETLWQVLNFIIAQGIIGLMFALLMMYVPDVKMQAAEGFIGGFITAVLFNAGKLGIGLYIGKAEFGSAYGAAGSMIGVLVWIYFSAQIVYFGAELTRALARAFGHAVMPRRGAGMVLVDASIPGASPSLSPAIAQKPGPRIFAPRSDVGKPYASTK